MSADDVRRRSPQFPTTSLGLVRLAAAGRGGQSREALETICRTYWYPLYAFIRRQGHDSEEAEDLTQAFIARVMERDTLRRFESERGRFRSFLLTCVKHFLAHERERNQARKRGGGRVLVPLDVSFGDAEARFGCEPADSFTPERIFERQWAHEVLARATDRLRAEFARRGRTGQFDALRAHLVGEGDTATYRELGLQLGMTDGAVKVAVHRLRESFHRALREEIALTVRDPCDVGDEVRYLISVLGAEP